jgi:hypothetical protein
MRTVTIVVISEHGERAFEVTSVHDQQPVQTFGPDRPNEPFRDPIRLRYLNRRANDPGALGVKHRVEAAGECPIVIANQETNRIPALSEHPRDLPRLLCHPLPVGLRGAARQMHAPAGDLDEEQWQTDRSTTPPSTSEEPLFYADRIEFSNRGAARTSSNPPCLRSMHGAFEILASLRQSAPSIERATVSTSIMIAATVKRVAEFAALYSCCGHRTVSCRSSAIRSQSGGRGRTMSKGAMNTCGHFIMEESPEETLHESRRSLRRTLDEN